MIRRFTILIHDHPTLHWDLLIEEGEGLLAWRLLEEPDTPRKIACEELPLHRRLYLDYEGPVSGNRGHVQQWTTGSCELKRESDGVLRLALESPRLTGELTLVRDSNGNWTAYPPGVEVDLSGSTGSDSVED
ncbi:MAG: DNA polymerase ligase N-terminal domain-containing protein [Planctomycetaceae bacterium]